MEYFGKTLRDCKDALEGKLKLEFGAEVIPATEEQLLGRGAKILPSAKKLPIFYTTEGTCYLATDLFLEEYGKDADKARAELARCLLYAGITKHGIEHTGATFVDSVLYNPYSCGPTIYATTLAGIFLREDLEYPEFPVNDRELLRALTKEREAASLAYGLAKRFHLESRNYPVVSALLYSVWDSTNQTERFQRISSMPYKQMVLQSGVNCIPHKDPIAVISDLKSLIEKTSGEIHSSGLQWRYARPKLRKIGMIAAGVDGINKDDIDKLFKALEQPVIDRNKIVVNTPLYQLTVESTLSNLLGELDEMLLSFGKGEPKTDIEKIGWIEFPLIKL
jgi:hypothetical protein